MGKKVCKGIFLLEEEKFLLEPSQVEKWVKDRMKENPFMTLIGAQMDEVKVQFEKPSEVTVITDEN